MISLEREQSKTSYEKLCKVIPGGVNSPVRSFKGLLETPFVAEKGIGDRIYDVDGRAYIDYVGSWGPLILGHADKEVVEAVKERLEKGFSFGATTEVELRLAQLLIEMTGMEQVRFVSSGTEATMSAVRLARGYTGKKVVVKFVGNYHGHYDGFLIQAGSGVVGIGGNSSSKGIPQEFLDAIACLPFNNVEAIEQFFAENASEVAAVILEPVAGNMGVVPATQAFMDTLRRLTKESGSLLIFDEVMCGFRVAKGGAKQLYQVESDLSVYGKVIGGGFPVAAFGGRREIMAELAPLGGVYQAGTLSGNPVAMEAGYQTLLKVNAPGFFEALEAKVQRLLNPIEAYLEERDLPVCLQRVGTMYTLFFGIKEAKEMADVQRHDAGLFKAFFNYLFDRGILIAPSQYEASFMSMAHSEESIDYTREQIISFLKSL